MKTVALIGKGSGAQDVLRGLPQGILSSDLEAWGLNDWRSQEDHGCSRWFQMHPPDILLPAEANWLRLCTVPIYTLADETATNPCAVVYPLGGIQEEFGRGAPFASSFDYMLALALHEGFERVLLVGNDVQIGGPRERLCEHVSLAYWIGLAAGRGIPVDRLGSQVLHFPYLYGYDFDAERTWAQRMVFWAALGLLNLGAFDDGQATTAAKGWRGRFGPDEVSVSI